MGRARGARPRRAGASEWRWRTWAAKALLVVVRVNPGVQWHFFLFLGGCPTKNGLPQKGFPFFPGSLKKLSQFSKGVGRNFRVADLKVVLGTDKMMKIIDACEKICVGVWQ